MNIEALYEYCLAKPGVSDSCPFSKLPNILVFKVADKMFLATDIENYSGFSFKYHSDQIEELKASNSCLVKAPYANPKHWLMVEFDGSEEETSLKSWIDTSYDLVCANLSKKTREAYGV